jgi:hypothetical protein
VKPCNLSSGRISSRMSSEHDTRAKKTFLPLALYHARRSSVTLRERMYLADLDILTLVCAAPASDGPRKNSVQTEVLHLRRVNV